MNILDKRFKYTNAASTDIRKTFARVRREQAAAAKAAPAPLHVVTHFAAGGGGSSGSEPIFRSRIFTVNPKAKAPK